MPSDSESGSPPVSRPRFANFMPSDPTITMLAALIVGAVIIFGALTPSRFLSGDTLRAIAFQMPELGILSLAMMFRYTFSRADIAARIEVAVRSVLAAGLLMLATIAIK